ncbi:MAG: histidine kinase [Anaerotignum sp.]|nr:histidine kinase [Anaerotignum sp.]
MEVSGILMLSYGFTNQPGFAGHKRLGNVFALFVPLPLLVNFYYIFYKMGLLSWAFPFPVFDFTPVAASISLMLFIIPTLAFRFFDISPISLGRLYNIVPQGLVFLDTKLRLYGGNQTFYSMLHLDKKTTALSQLQLNSKHFDQETAKQFLDFVINSNLNESEINLTNGRNIKMMKHKRKNRHILLCLNDITKINQNRMLLSKQNKELAQKANLLKDMADTTKALAIARTKSQMAQNVHDILGHSLTVMIGTAELAVNDPVAEAVQKVDQIEELLICSLNDLRNALTGNGLNLGETSLIKAIGYLKNENVHLDLQIHGITYELTREQTKAIYRLCQEAVTNAMKHGKAKTIYLILRFQPQQVKIFALDNGIGYRSIKKNYGISGIETRIQNLSGTIDFSSDGESGFTIRATLPKQNRD